MSEITGIEWTDATWNPWHGCIKVSPGCKNCYMYRDKARYGQDPTKVVRSKSTFNDPLRWKEPLRVFTCSWSDFFIEQADPWREDAYKVIMSTPHTYQILTKRPERVSGRFSYLDNVWLGVSVEDKQYGLPRIDILRTIQAPIRFLSIEPLLEDLGEIDLSGIDWVIVGGESGHEARPMLVEWAESIKLQCEEQNVKFFMKQLSQHDTKEFKDYDKFDASIRAREFPA